MPHGDTTARLVIDNWPGFSDMVGDDVTRRIAAAVAAGQDPRELYHREAGGEPFDFYGLIELLGSAAGIVEFGLTFHDRFRTRTGRPPTRREIHDEMVAEAERRDLPEEITEQVGDVAESILREAPDPADASDPSGPADASRPAGTSGPADGTGHAG